MTLKYVSNLFENLIDETSKKSEIKIYQEFIQIITSLENKDLSENEIKFSKRYRSNKIKVKLSKQKKILQESTQCF